MSDRPCTCHPDDNPPVPCPQKFALSECKVAAQGWKLVPVEPTMGMYDDWNTAIKNGPKDGFFGTWIAAYHAMIDAVPAAPETVAWMIVEPGCEEDQMTAKLPPPPMLRGFPDESGEEWFTKRQLENALKSYALQAVRDALELVKNMAMFYELHNGTTLKAVRLSIIEALLKEYSK